MTLHPAPDRLVLELIEQQHESTHGIVMSNRSAAESPKGRVVDIGFEARSRFEGIQSGDTVFFSPGRGEVVVIEGGTRVIVHLGDVLAWVSEQAG